MSAISTQEAAKYLSNLDVDLQEANESLYRTKVLEPLGEGYTKNSVDIVIVDSDGKVVRRYQSKYCKDAKATEQAFAHGD